MEPANVSPSMSPKRKLGDDMGANGGRSTMAGLFSGVKVVAGVKFARLAGVSGVVEEPLSSSSSAAREQRLGGGVGLNGIGSVIDCVGC